MPGAQNARVIMSKYLAHHIKYVRRIAKGKNNRTITEMFNNKFDTNVSVESIKNMIHRNKIKQRPLFLYTDEMEQWMADNVPGRHFKEAAALFNMQFNTEKSADELRFKCRRLGLKNGMKNDECRLPLGSTAIFNRTIYIKIGNEGKYCYRHGKWKVKSRYVWEQAHGAIPKGYVVFHLDGNKSNFELDNLEIATSIELQMLSKYELSSNNKEQVKTVLAIIRHRRAIYRIFEREYGKIKLERFQRSLNQWGGYER